MCEIAKFCQSIMILSCSRDLSSEEIEERRKQFDSTLDVDHSGVAERRFFIIATIIIIIITIMTVINHHDYLGHNRVDNLTPQFSVDITALVEIIVTPAFTVNSSIRLTLLSRKQMELTKDAKSHIHLDYGSLTR